MKVPRVAVLHWAVYYWVYSEVLFGDVSMWILNATSTVCQSTIYWYCKYFGVQETGNVKLLCEFHDLIIFRSSITQLTMPGCNTAFRNVFIFRNYHLFNYSPFLFNQRPFLMLNQPINHCQTSLNLYFCRYVIQVHCCEMSVVCCGVKMTSLDPILDKHQFLWSGPVVRMDNDMLHGHLFYWELVSGKRSAGGQLQKPPQSNW